MSSIVVSGDTSGAVTLSAPAVAGTVTVTLPAASGTMASLASVTANGVAYINSSGQPTSGSALVFNGTNLGLGVTPSSWGAGTSVIDLATSGSAGAVSASGTLSIANNGFFNGTDWIYKNTSSALLYQLISNQHRWSIAPSGTAGNAITFTQAMTLDASGRLGLGTTSPTTPLQIQTAAATGVNSIFCTGSTTAYNFWTISNTSGNARIGVDSSSGGALATGSSAYSTVIGSPNATPLHLISNGAVQATVDTSGNLLVGTTSASSKLTVYSSTGGGGYFFVTNASSQTTAAVTFSKFDNTTTTAQVFCQFVINNGGTGSGQINANGANSAAFGTYSDSRLKENIVDLPSQLANIMALRPVEYDYIETEGGGHQIGFVAQEVQEIYPDLVGERADGMLTLADMNKNDARLIKAIQEQQALITTLTARITALEGA